MLFVSGDTDDPKIWKKRTFFVEKCFENILAYCSKKSAKRLDYGKNQLILQDLKIKEETNSPKIWVRHACKGFFCFFCFFFVFFFLWPHAICHLTSIGGK